MISLTKIRLINWHYFTNETILVKGSSLFSGENASGKSTILDAVQLVLTNNSRKFNPAANTNSKRDLRGYVRCKTGEEGNTYVRSTGSVISYVALEFHEEAKDKYFVLGVKLDSQDLDAEIIKKWFIVEGRLDSITFIVDGKPATDKEFTQNGKKIQLENQVSRASRDFKIRMGRLDENFSDMIIKSMAFKPMDKVKDFINKFILPENEVKTENLQENIRNLRELQKLINEVRYQIEQLHKIMEKADAIEDTEYKMLVVDVLLKIAVLEDKKNRLIFLNNKKESDEAGLNALARRQELVSEKLKTAESRYNEIFAAIQTNECGRLIEKIEASLAQLDIQKAKLENDLREYEGHLNKVEAAAAVADIIAEFTPSNHNDLLAIIKDPSDEGRINAAEALEMKIRDAQDKAQAERARAVMELTQTEEKLRRLDEKISQLKKNRIVYDANTTRLLNAISEEFAARKLDSQPRVFADLLEIAMPEWQNAVEGYLNTQRFNIIVDPKYYDVAAQVYDRMKSRIHSAGLVNVGRLMNENKVMQEESLADAVTTENRYARAYADYLLGRVVRCGNVAQLKQYNVAVTKECMKYQGHVLSKISDEVYKNPYIGRRALEIQLENAQKEYAGYSEIKNKLEKQIADCEKAIRVMSACNFDSFKKLFNAERELSENKERIAKEKKELKEAKSNPNFIELNIKYEAAGNALEKARLEDKSVSEAIINKKRDIEEDTEKIILADKEAADAGEEKEKLTAGNTKAAMDAQGKYNELVRSKEAGTIASNYEPRRKTLSNQREAALKALVELQSKYKNGDFGTGTETIGEYRDDLIKLEKSDLISYEDKLAKAREDCEVEFRENFLARMRENIEKAHDIFRSLNKSLKDIYYGNDSYKFELSANRERKSLYDMITSDMNIAGDNLFSATFEEKYHEEMEDLFNKLADENLAETSAVRDLTDYRSYLDYDIMVENKNGGVQRFSKTYGEKSGGETQTPYYVAIAASFAQMYSYGETIRIIMLDEAFNNMDEDRINSMMEFFKSQNFQVILAAPSARMETIGEHVDSIFLVIRSGNCSTVEEYYL